LRNNNDDSEGGDDSEFEGDACHDTPEEVADNDAQANVRDEWESVEESEGNPQDNDESFKDDKLIFMSSEQLPRPSKFQSQPTRDTRIHPRFETT